MCLNLRNACSGCDHLNAYRHIELKRGGAVRGRDLLLSSLPCFILPSSNVPFSPILHIYVVYTKYAPNPSATIPVRCVSSRPPFLRRCAAMGGGGSTPIPPTARSFFPISCRTRRDGDRKKAGDKNQRIIRDDEGAPSTEAGTASPT